MMTMKHTLGFGTVALIVLATASMPVSAERPPAAGKSAGLPARSGPEDSARSERAEEMLKQRQRDMLELHDLMHRIRDAKDPQEKSRLTEQHLQMLRDNWEEMRAHRRSHQRPPTRRGGQGAAEPGSDGLPPGDGP